MPTSHLDRCLRLGALLAVLSLGAAQTARAQCVSLTTGSTYTQNFDTLASTSTSSAVPQGWAFAETGSNTNTTYTAGPGSGSTGDTYSFGATGATERAFGGLQSGSLVPTIGACFTNDTGSAITTASIAYTGEQWRLGTAGRVDRIDFKYSSDATSLTTGTWVDVDALDFTAPITSGTLGALNGNASANRRSLVSTLSGLSVAEGATFWVRWTDFNATGADDGLAVDDFSLTPNPKFLSIDDVTAPEGDSGTTTFRFTVSLTMPAPAGGVTFDIATADGTATTADGDYTARSLTAQTIAEGDSTYTFDVIVNGDTAIETDETFFVDVTNVSGGFTAVDGQGVGTIRNDDFPLSISIDDVSAAEGDSGTTPFAFTVSLSAPAPAGGVTFDIATSDGTATTADADYVAKSFTAQTIAEGDSTYTFDVSVNGDTAIETDETFFVDVTNVTGAVVNDGRGVGTITNDDVILTPIHGIQGSGASSPITGAVVTTRGIVTGVKTNGFFIQTPDASADADPATSEGIFVFTSSAPPVAAALGNLVQVVGTVAEYVPSADPLQPPLTEIITPTVGLMTSGNPLPSPVPLTTTFPAPTGGVDQLERLEGMRVSVASLTVVGPTLGNVNEPNATATSTGVFFGVVTGVPRPFREPGIRSDDPAPSGSIPPIPRFDANPERIRVDSDGLVGGPLIDVGTGAVVTGLVGPLDYSFRTYTILPDPATPPSVTGGPTPTPVSSPTAAELTVASFNLERFFDDQNDPAISEPVLTTTAFDSRLGKASLAIRDYLKTPDILGVQEVESLATLEALAARISADAVAESRPDPQYTAYLAEGNDVGGIDVGFLVKSAPVTGTTPRVEVVEVVQELDDTLFTNLDASTELLNDRPPLRLAAVVHGTTQSFPVTVIVNHLRSLNGVDSAAAGSNGWATVGARVRAKRLAQAVDLASLVQARQTADPAERILLVGDFNAFDFNDGFVDSMSVIQGTPTSDDETVVPGDGVDLVDPDLTRLVPSSPTERYSFVFDGNAQSLDHILVNEAMTAATTAQRVEHARIGADFPETARNDGATAIRLADHDPIMAYFTLPSLETDLGITKTNAATTVEPGQVLTYTIVAFNAGPDAALGATVTDLVPASLTAVSWTCAGSDDGTCAASGSGSIDERVDLPAGGSVTFSLTATLSAGATGTLSNTASIAVPAGALDPNDADNSATDTDAVAPHADLSVTTTNGLTAVVPGETVTYTIVASNAGPVAVIGAAVSSSLPAGFTAVTWACTGSAGGTCAASGSGDLSETVNLPVGGSVSFTLTGTLDPAVFGTLANTAIIMPPLGVIDPDTSNNLATDTDPLAPHADLSITKTDGRASATPGGTVVYTIVASNAGPSAATGATVVDSVPSAITSVTWTCSGASGGACGAASGSGSIDEAVSLPVGASVTFTLTGTVESAATGTLSNTASVLPPAGVTDPTPSNDTATDTNTLGLGFYAVTPCRVVDTRGGAPVGGPAVAGGETRVFLLANQCGIPTAATAVSLNITVTGATAPGHIRLFPTGTVPSISTINYSTGQTRANNAVVTLSATGEIGAFAGQAAGTVVHLIIDVNGYFQ